eukprot:scaffold1521_cov271-Chaetoceros_neogracile.AAC.62
MDDSVLKTTHVKLCLQDITNLQDFGKTTVAFAFDKAFTWDLMAHMLLCLINSPNICSFVCTKPSHPSSTLEWCASCLIMETGCFEIRGGRLGNCFMNDNESAGHIHTYDKTKTVKITIEWVYNWLERFNSRTNISDLVWNTWISAKEEAQVPFLLDHDPTIRGYSEQNDKGMKEREKYYTATGDINLLTADERNTNGVQDQLKGTCLANCGIPFRCFLQNKCEDCKTMFPDDTLARKHCKEKESQNQKGKGLYAIKGIITNSFVCEYSGTTYRKIKKGANKGKFSTGRNSKKVHEKRTMKGAYFASHDEGFIDAIKMLSKICESLFLQG